MRLFFIAVFLLFVCPWTAFAADPMERYQKASALIREDRSEEAKHELLNLVDSDPGFAPAYYSLGVIQLKHEDMAGAIRYFRKSLELGADSAIIHYLLASTLARKGEADAAKQSYLTAIQKNPLMDNAHHDLGMLYYLTGEYEKAVLSLQKALFLSPASTNTMLLLGMAYIKDERPENAVGLVTSLREAKDEVKALKLESLLRESQSKKKFVEPDKQYLTPGGPGTQAQKPSRSASKQTVSITGNAKMTGKVGQSQSTRNT